MFRSTPPDRIRLTIPRSAAPVLIRRLGLAIREGCDEGGVLLRLLKQIAEEATRDGSRVRVECRSCGYVWHDVPLIGRCVVCDGRYLHIELPERG